MPVNPPLLLLTRPQAASERFAEQLGDVGAAFTPVMSPLIGIDVHGPLPPHDDIVGLVFTSAHGVRAWQLLGGSTLPSFTVGQATARAAKRAGMLTQSADGNADALVKMLANLRPNGTLLHVRGHHSRGDVASRLTEMGFETRQAIVYDQPQLPPSKAALDALRGDDPVVAPIFSPRTAAILAQLPIKAPLLVAAMSEAVVSALGSLHISELKIAPHPESHHMVALTGQLLESARNRS